MECFQWPIKLLSDSDLAGALPHELPSSLEIIKFGEDYKNTNKLSGTIPSAWAALTNLKELEMVKCGLGRRIFPRSPHLALTTTDGAFQIIRFRRGCRLVYKSSTSVGMASLVRCCSLSERSVQTFPQPNTPSYYALIRAHSRGLWASYQSAITSPRGQFIARCVYMWNLRYRSPLF